MPLPSARALYHPVLQVLAERSPLRRRDLLLDLAQRLRLTEDELNERLPSGGLRFRARVRWVLVELQEAGLVERSERGVYAVTDEGRHYAETGIDAKTIRRRVRERQGPDGRGDAEPPADHGATPDERIDDAVDELDTAVERELLQRVRELSPQAFEQLVLELLKAMGYGEGLRVGRTGDQGVDVEITQDALGLDRVHVQAKRYGDGATVGSRAIREFLGALDMRGAQKGVFVTSGTFTPDAIAAARGARRQVALVDGAQLVRLMRTGGVGVRERRRIVLHDLDEEFFLRLEEEA